MRYWLLGFLTLLAALTAIVGFFFLFIFLCNASPPSVPGWLMNTAFVVGALTALFTPTLLMTRVPVRCPNCGGPARFRYLSWLTSAGPDGFKTAPKFGYTCYRCGWAPYYPA